MFSVSHAVCSAARYRKGTLFVVKSLVISPQRDLTVVKTRGASESRNPSAYYLLASVIWKRGRNVDLMSGGTTSAANNLPSMQRCVRKNL